MTYFLRKATSTIHTSDGVLDDCLFGKHRVDVGYEVEKYARREKGEYVIDEGTSTKHSARVRRGKQASNQTRSLPVRQHSCSIFGSL